MARGHGAKTPHPPFSLHNRIVRGRFKSLWVLSKFWALRPASACLPDGGFIWLFFATGMAQYMGWVDLPDKLHALDVLANPWVMGVSGIAAIAEFFADKVPWLDSAWDSVHTLIRPVGGALLALAVVEPSDPAWQVLVFILGGGATLLSHGAKAGTRVAVNASPEPVSNVVTSTTEDVVTGGLLYLVLADPMTAGIVALVLFIACVAMIWWLRRMFKRLFTREKPKDVAPAA